MLKRADSESNALMPGGSPLFGHSSRPAASLPDLEADIRTSWERDWLEPLAGRQTLPPSLHPPAASLCTPAPAPLAPTTPWHRSKWRQRIFSRCAHGPRYMQVLEGSQRVLCFREAALASFGGQISKPSCHIPHGSLASLSQPCLPDYLRDSRSNLVT